MSTRLTNVELSQRAGALGKVAYDAATAREKRGVAFDGKNDAVDPTAYDAIHDSCVALLSGLAKAGHKRSHALLNPSAGRKPEGGAPNPAAHDSVPKSEDAAHMLANIRL